MIESLMRSTLILLLTLTALSAGKPSFQEMRKLTEAPSPKLAAALTEFFCETDLAKGMALASEGPDFLFAIAAGGVPRLVVDDGRPLPMTRVASSNLWFATPRLRTGVVHTFHYQIKGQPFGGKADVPAFGPYSYAKPGVPAGRLSEKFTHRSRVYPGMDCDYWVYTPAQYDPARPAAVMVWQDGEVLVPRELPSRAQIVFDNLSHEKKIPVVVHVLISPGFVDGVRIRAEQYDEVSDRYARFLLEEILPDVGKRFHLRQDGYSRAIAGDSSGGICAFNAAWQKPESFTRVLSRIGSFTSIWWKPGTLDGGNIFPFLIRKSPKRNIRVWLQEGAGDLENEHGSWPSQNLAMANSLKLQEYDFHFSWGEGGHSRNCGHVELAEELIWLWRGYQPAETTQDFTMDPAENGKPMFRIKALNRQ